jgi:hypothetical protein
VGLYEVKYNPTEKQLVINLVVLTFKKKLHPPGIEPGPVNQEANALSTELSKLG